VLLAIAQKAALAAMAGWLKEWKPTGESSEENVTDSEGTILQREACLSMPYVENDYGPKPINPFFKGSARGTF
jgi:hypothetical protein